MVIEIGKWLSLFTLSGVGRIDWLREGTILGDGKCLVLLF